MLQWGYNEIFLHVENDSVRKIYSNFGSGWFANKERGVTRWQARPSLCHVNIDSMTGGCALRRKGSEVEKGWMDYHA
eukprot:764456-Hanusia_phi.AAC.1